MKLILSSNNPGKLSEFACLFSGWDGMELLTLNDAGLQLHVEENGSTFEENACLKARAVTEATGAAAVADDSGLMVEALGGEPGVYSARYGAGIATNDDERTAYLLSRLGDEENRRAKFVCCICCTMPNGDVLTARGEMPGTIARTPRGTDGFGYDPVFIPDGFDRTNAELTMEEKNAVSHRGNAMRSFIRIFEEYINKSHDNEGKS